MLRIAALVAVAAASASPTFAKVGEAAFPLPCTIHLPSIGCYDDSAGPHPLNFSMPIYTSLSLTDCQVACNYAGFPLFAVTGHASPSPAAYCFCDVAIDPAAVVAKSPSECNLPCPGGGNPGGPCGANYRTSVYNTTCSAPLPNPVAPPGPALAPGPACSQPESAGWAFCNKQLPLQQRVDDLVARLTPLEIGPQLTARQAPAIPRLGIPSFYFGTNYVHGVTNAVTGGILCTKDSGRCPTIFPAGGAQGASFNETAWGEMGRLGGVEIRALNNINWRDVAGMDGLTSWGITINLQRAPSWGRNQEVPTSDPYLMAKYATNFVKGMQYGEDARYIRVATTLKHFAAYSLEDYYTPSGQHVTRENFNAVVSDFDLFDTYLPHFRAAFLPVSQGGAGALGVMLAMNSIGGTPCTANTFLTNLLFDVWGFDGYVTSDGGNMITDMVVNRTGHNWCPYHAPPCSVDEALEAAANARCAVADGNEYMDHTVTSMAYGNVTEAAIRLLVADTMKLRFRLGLFDNLTAADSPYWAYGEADLASPAAQLANSIAAREGLILLQLGDDGSGKPALPFPRGAGGTTAVIGYAVNATSKLVGNYVSQYCADPSVDCFPTILASVAALGEATSYAPGCSDAQTCSASQIAAAAAAAASASRVVLQLGLDQTLEREQLDREDINLPAPQQALFAAVSAAAAGKPLAVVLIHGGAVAIPEVKASRAAVLDAFYPGTLGGPAIADALFGVFSPGGKLPIDVYNTTYEEVDFTDMSFASLGRTYRYYTGPNTPGGAPLYPFGWGLSYSTFDLSWSSGSAPAPIVVTASSGNQTFALTVTNTGGMAGDEVVQAYVVPSAATLTPQPPFVPTRYLVGFRRVTVPQGGASDASITLGLVDALTVTADAKGTRTLVSGSYTLVLTRMGAAGAPDDLSVQVTVQA